jgi:hypothetical protein
MGCPSEVNLTENVTFSITTHDPDTGVLTDADAVPNYRIYEDDTATAILTGDMAKLDDSNTTGFYVKKIAATTANGFNAGKNYTVYIEATVDSDKGGMTYGFRVGSSAAGAISWPITINDDSATPIADVDVWVTTDVAGAYVVASGKTDNYGVVTFMLDAGTYYCWRQKSGINFVTNPATITVSA